MLGFTDSISLLTQISSETLSCQAAVAQARPDAGARCELAWHLTGEEAAAAAGAKHAYVREDAVTLRRWADRALPTLEGARILHYWGCLQRKKEDLTGAEQTLRRALALRIDRDPARATNTALELLKLVQSYRSAEESIDLAVIAWEQAELGGVPLSRSMAARWLSELLIDMGELRAADLLIRTMDTGRYRALRDHAEGLLRAAGGWPQAAVALFERASAAHPDVDDAWRLDAMIDLVHAHLAQGRTRDARRVLDEAVEVAAKVKNPTVNARSRMAAAKASVALEEGDIDGALDEVNRGLAQPSRDAARVLLLRIRGDVYARRESFAAAEAAWADAADEIEAWRASIPSIDLRAGLLTHHRRALESWLDSAAVRGDLDGVLEVARRMLGRALLDRLRSRHVAASADAGTSLRRVLQRVQSSHDKPLRVRGAEYDLRKLRHDLVAILNGARTVWAIRHQAGRWSISRVGDRRETQTLVDAHRADLDNKLIAARLGEVMFPADTLPEGDRPLVVALDRELADIPLASLRSGGRYLVEHAPILEVMAPHLLSVPLRAGPWGPAIALGDPQHNLPAAREEARAFERMTSGRAYLGEEATPAAAAGIAGAVVAHLAVHSAITDGRAAFWFHGGILTGNEIVAQGLAPRLAVVATCRSHVDDDPATSLAAAFLAAGASGVIGVKRTFDDQAGTTLIRDFYAHGGVTDPLGALAKAQRAAIRANRPTREWASVSFFGVGGWIHLEGQP